MNPDFMLILVQSIQQYPYIWDTHYPQYNHRELTEKAWKDISDYCEQPVHVCKTKWKNVRTGFFRSLMKNRRFHLFDSMQFMLPVFLRNETFAKKMKQYNLLNYSKTVNNESEIVKIEDSSSEPLNDDELEELENSTDSKGNQRYFSEFSFLNNSTKQETSTTSLKRDCASTSIILDDNDSSSSSAKKSKTTDNSVTQITKEEQALMSFFKGIAPDVLSLSAQNQRFLKRKIVEMVDDLHSETSETITNGSISSKKCQSLNSTNGIINNES